MSNDVPPPGQYSGPLGDDPDSNIPRRGAHRAPVKPQRTLGLAAIALAAVVALLVAFTSCGDGFESGQGVIEAPSTSAPVASTAPATPASTPPPTTPASPSPTAASTTAPASPTATPTPTTTSSPTASPTPPTGPLLPVVVLNGTRITGLAASAATEVRDAGWQVSTTGNWRRTTVATSTVFFGPGDEGSARRLARDLPGNQRVAPVLTGMSTTSLTYVVTN